MPKFGDLVSSFTDATGTGIMLNQNGNNKKQDPIAELLGDTKRELDEIIRQQRDIIQVIGAQQTRNLVDEHTQNTISEQLYYTLNPFKDNWYEIFAALNEADSTLLTQNSIRQEDMAEAIVYRLGTAEVGRYDKTTQRYSILGKNISIKQDKKRYVNNKRCKPINHEATKQRLQMILDYIASKVQQAQQKTNDVIKNDAHFQTELKRTALLDAIMPYYETQENTFWVEPGEVDIAVIVKSFFEDGYTPEEREIDDYRPIFKPGKDMIEFFDFDAYLAGSVVPMQSSCKVVSYDFPEEGDVQKTYYNSNDMHNAPDEKHLYLESIDLPEHCIAKITIYSYNDSREPDVYYLIGGSKKVYQRVIDHINNYSKVRQLLKDPLIHKLIHNSKSTSQD